MLLNSRQLKFFVGALYIKRKLEKERTQMRKRRCELNYLDNRVVFILFYFFKSFALTHETSWWAQYSRTYRMS